MQKVGSATPSSQQQDKMREKINQRMDKIKHKLIIISGKGGVGKSMVAVNLAYGLPFQGTKGKSKNEHNRKLSKDKERNTR